MPDLRIKSIEMRNWQKVKSSKITFPEKGLVLVTGSNLASEGKLESVGAGKTALGEALARALLGVNGRYAHLGYYLTDTEKSNMYVKLEAELLKKPLTVEMGFKCPELVGDGEALKFTYGDNAPFQGARADQTRARLEQTLGVTTELANWTAFIDGDKLKFSRLSQEDSVNILMTALAQPPWTEFHELATKKLRAANQQVELSDQELQNAKSRVDTLTEELNQAIFNHGEAEKYYQHQVDQQQENIKVEKNKIGGNRAALQAAEEAMVQIKKQLKLLEDQRAAQNHQWEIERQEQRDKLGEHEIIWTKSGKLHAQRLSQLEQADDVLAAMKKVPKTCPTCNKDWDKAHSAVEMKKAQDRVTEAEKAYAEADKDYNAETAKRRAISAKITEIEKKMRECGKTGDVEHLGDQYSKNERLARNLTASIHQLELEVARLEKPMDASAVTRKATLVDERRRLLKASDKEIEMASSNLVMDQEALKVVQYWHKAFSPTGIPNMILTEAIPLLNRVAQRISNLMTGGTLQVTYSTTRELVKGESKPQLVTKVTNRIGSKRLEGSSKGEGGLTNLIISENLSEVGQVSSRIGFRWYDEVTSGQDQVVRRSIFAYLKDMAERMGILIFAVDHHPEAASYADYVLVAEKTLEHGTRYFWR